MDTRRKACCALAGIALLLISRTIPLGAQDVESLPLRILKWSEADQVAWLKSHLAAGAPPGDELTMLVLNRSSIVLPILEQEIAAILSSKSPRELFSNPAADPEHVVNVAAASIQYAGDENSLREASKLMKIDEHRFGEMVYAALLHAGTNRNPFTVAYQGFGIGDPQVDKRIVAWADERLKAGEDYDHLKAKRLWAEAMVEKYDGVPSGSQWTVDPIVSRLDLAKNTGLHDEMLPLAVEAERKRSKR